MNTQNIPAITDEFLSTRPLSKTSLMAFRRSPAHYINYLMEPKVQTDALVLGSLLDCMVFAPMETAGRFIVAPDINKRTNEGRAAWQQFQEDNATKTIVTADQWKTAEHMTAALMLNPKSNEYLTAASHVQRRLNWTDTEHNLPFVGIADADSETPDFVIDLKTSANPFGDDFARDAFKYGYHIQSALYLEGFRRALRRFPTFMFIVVEKEPPYGVAVYDKIADPFFKLGNQEIHRLKTEFRYCMDENLFHKTYDFRTVDGGLILDLPGWAKQKIEE